MTSPMNNDSNNDKNFSECYLRNTTYAVKRVFTTENGVTPCAHCYHSPNDICYGHKYWHRETPRTPKVLATIDRHGTCYYDEHDLNGRPLTCLCGGSANGCKCDGY